jgi:hypothetical protein
MVSCGDHCVALGVRKLGRRFPEVLAMCFHLETDTLQPLKSLLVTLFIAVCGWLDALLVLSIASFVVEYDGWIAMQNLPLAMFGQFANLHAIEAVARESISCITGVVKSLKCTNLGSPSLLSHCV